MVMVTVAHPWNAIHLLVDEPHLLPEKRKVKNYFQEGMRITN